ncbi:hypothetical protein HanRHA438_Chr03g0125051 [Helianthus annuus]|nr:hypothetical protein HanOQP8_Chr03g0107141 [Helianthus annuus]KAJ0935928.1 hypothetical protein HanRHA438_Chr03g0125051 [Helianthus annuus]
MLRDVMGYCVVLRDFTERCGMLRISSGWNGTWKRITQAENKPNQRLKDGGGFPDAP